ncbi:MAG TPA: hypothetical protein VMS43_06900 [Allosphingosinicella sp.]|nr:hypothetical protein [Allosphingosinicella sp.]
MSRSNPFIAAGAAATLALAGCGAPAENEAAANRNAVAESRTENGQLTVRAQGVDLKIDLPPPLRRMAGDRDGAFLYPGAVAGSGDRGDRFHSDDSPDVVARWYRDPARAPRFAITIVERQGPAFVLTGTARGGDGLRIRLTPGARGEGTDGQITLSATE